MNTIDSTTYDSATWLLLLNPISGGGLGVRNRGRIESTITAHGIRHVAVLSEFPGHIIALVTDAIQRGCRRILVAGGDGSLSEAVNGICAQQTVASDQITLALLPIGTGNDWARGRDIPGDYDHALDLIAAGHTHLHDVGIIDFTTAPTGYVRRYFINVAGTGFDAGVIERMPSRKLGRLAYLVGLLRELVGYRAVPLQLKTGSQRLETSTFVFFACIGRYCGGGMLVAPQAQPDDGLFDLTLVRHLGRIELLMNLKRLFDGSLPTHPKVSTWQGDSVEIEAPHGAAIEADGELVGHAPARLAVAPRAVRIIGRAG